MLFTFSGTSSLLPLWFKIKACVATMGFAAGATSSALVFVIHSRGLRLRIDCAVAQRRDIILIHVHICITSRVGNSTNHVIYCLLCARCLIAIACALTHYSPTTAMGLP